jgi:hypothetical protein
MIGGTYWNMKKTMRDLDAAGVGEYNMKRVRLDKHSSVVEQVLKNRLELMKEKEISKENTIKINELINDVKK